MPSATKTPKRPSAIAQKLAKLGLVQDMDFALHFPLRYEDETRLVSIQALFPGSNAQVEGEVVDQIVQYRGRRQLLVQIKDAQGDGLTLRFLHFYGSQLTQLSPGAQLRVRGQVRRGLQGMEMVHPSYRLIRTENKEDEEVPALPTTLTPIYPATSGVSQTYLRKAIKSALTRVVLPELWTEQEAQQWDMQFVTALHLPSLAQSVEFLHNPPPGVQETALLEHTHPAWMRVKFEELLAQQLSLQQAHAKRRACSAPAMPACKTSAEGQPFLVTSLLQSLPFTLTAAQQRVQREIEEDLSTPHPMQRLLQGDVGSGKTIVAALAAAQAIQAGYQVAFMAPTDILAEQHYQKLSTWFTPLGVQVARLSGSMKPKDKRNALEAIAFGQAQLVIGTHAIIQNTVEFACLGLAIVDEQHRFGVDQRLALQAKAQRMHTPDGTPIEKILHAHQLMMSATPIPRTLAMSYYADLDLSIIDELPPNRSPVRTKLVTQTRREEIVERIRAAVLAGRQIYWVCPLIEESEVLELQAAMDTFTLLSEALPDLTVGLVHGRLHPSEKTQVMEGFVSGKTHVLVATTVIEVGVDVPNASLMVIEHAERFGLSQLHQLRGRVGRGEAASVCVLLYAEPLSWTARARLRTMHETQDGFVIAQRDLELRGPGELLGARQSGAMLLRFADLQKDEDLVSAASRAATQLLRHAPDVVRRHLERWLGSREAYLTT